MSITLIPEVHDLARQPEVLCVILVRSDCRGSSAGEHSWVAVTAGGPSTLSSVMLSRGICASVPPVSRIVSCDD